MSTTYKIFTKPQPKQLSQVLASISDVGVMEQFLTDVLTNKEIQEVSARLQAATMLQQGKIYTEIIDVTGLSSTTVARISKWVKNGQGGYTKIFNALKH